MIISPIIEIWRHTFPKNLRFCRQCQILHAQLSAVDKRYKDRKFIPRAEISSVIDCYTDGPLPLGIPVFRWPVIRQLCFLRGVNGFRVYRGYPSWLYTGAVRAEHRRIAQWFDKNGNTLWIRRDKFKEEVLDQFQVAQQYHKFFLAGMAAVCAMLLFIAAGAISEPLLYTYLVYVRGMDREQVRDYMATILEEHATVDTPERYKDVLPPTSFRLSSSSATNASNNSSNGSDDTIYFNVVEMTSPTGNARVIFIPCPKIAPVDYYRKVGEICKNCSAVVLEEVPLEYLHQLPPAFFFFADGRDNSPFPSLNLHHRVLDIVPEDSNQPPPKLLPGSVKPSGAVRYLLGLMPFSFKVLYFPYFLTGTKSDARIGWGTLKAVIKGEGFFPSHIEHQLDRRDEQLGRLKNKNVKAIREAEERLAKQQMQQQQHQSETSASAKLLPGSKSQQELEEQQQKEQQQQQQNASRVHEQGGIAEDMVQQEVSGTRPNLTSQPSTQFDPMSPNILTSERRIYPSIAVPWTVAQISNLEASMYRAGWKVTNTAAIEWISPKQVGAEFYDWHKKRMGESLVLGTAAAKVSSAVTSTTQQQQQQPAIAAKH